MRKGTNGFAVVERHWPLFSWARRALLVLVVCGLSTTALAVPACPAPGTVVQPDGSRIGITLQGDERLHWNEDTLGYPILRSAGGTWVYGVLNGGSLTPTAAVVGQADPRAMGLARIDSAAAQKMSAARSSAQQLDSDTPSRIPTTGTRANLVILVNFSDSTITSSNADFDHLFNDVGYTTDGAQGSVRDFYNETSYGLLTVTSTIAGPVTVSNGYAYYGANNASGNDLHPKEMVTEALAALEATGFDFSPYDLDHDGWIDGLTIIHAGGGEEYGGNNADYIWSHKSALSSTVTYDGVSMKTYHTEPARRGWDSTPSTQGITRIGVICHENGHFYGLPDLYDYGYDSKGVGNFCLMSGGSWGGNYGTRPVQISAWCKAQLSWLTPTTLTAAGDYSLSQAETNQQAYRVDGPGWNNKEYFLIENRQGTGFDASLPGTNRGVLIWHVDENQANNNDQTHFKVDLEEASGTQHLEANTNSGDDDDYFRLGNVTTFDDTTTPNSHAYAGTLLGWSVTSIGATGSTMTFTLVDNKPAAPTNVTASDTDSTKVHVTWTASSDATGYDVYRYTANTSGSATKISGATPLTETSYDDTTAVIGTTYWYWVKALNDSGPSAFGTPDSGLRPGVFTLSGSSVTVPEDGTQTLTVALASQPPTSVTVAVARTAGDTDLTVSSGASLTFTTGNWDTPQTVTLAAAADTDAINGQATVSVSATGYTTADVTATEGDDDAYLVASTTSISVPEAGTQTFTVALAGQPASDVTVAVARTAGDTDLTVSRGASLTFTDVNWATPQTVTVAAANDTDAVDGTATITASSAGWTSADVTATETDDDARLLVSSSSVSVPEAGTRTFTVALAGQPAGDVSVAVARTAGDTDLTVSGGASLTFTNVNWATPQTVTVAAAADVDAINGTATITASAVGWTSADVTATEADTTRNLICTPSSLTVPEGSALTFGVRLAGQPAADVTVGTGRVRGATNLRVSAGASLTFTPANWSTSQLVTISALEDADAINGQATFRASVSGWTSADVVVTEQDNDQRILVAPSRLTMTEGGTRTFSVRLAGQPAADVNVGTSRLSGDTSLSASAGDSLTFTPSNWYLPQLVTIAAAEDTDALDGEATFRVAATGFATADVVATAIDNDRCLVATPTSVSVPEGGTQSFNVALAGQPAADVIVCTGRVRGDTSLVPSAGSRLTFTPSNWNVPQAVTLFDREDVDAVNGQATFRASATGWVSADVLANEVDNDLRLIATPTSLTVPEGGTKCFSVRLAGQPASNVVVGTGRVRGDSSLRVSAGASLTFTPSNWNIAQLVTIYALPDSDTINGQATFRASLSGWQSVDVVVTEQEPRSAPPSMAPAPDGGS